MRTIMTPLQPRIEILEGKAEAPWTRESGGCGIRGKSDCAVVKIVFTQYVENVNMWNGVNKKKKGETQVELYFVLN